MDTSSNIFDLLDRVLANTGRVSDLNVDLLEMVRGLEPGLLRALGQSAESASHGMTRNGWIKELDADQLNRLWGTSERTRGMLFKSLANHMNSLRQQAHMATIYAKLCLFTSCWGEALVLSTLEARPADAEAEWSALGSEVCGLMKDIAGFYFMLANWIEDVNRKREDSY